jgi:predicted glycosyltransferase
LKFWVDALTPKQLIFFQVLRLKLEGSGHEVIMTTREYHDVEYVVKRLKMDARFVGKHGGARKPDKLIESISRSAELAKIISNEPPDRAVSFGSPEAARVAFGLGIPHFAVNDSPHSKYVARLSLPLSVMLFCPWVIPFGAWREFGVRRENIRQYRALDPAAWLKEKEIWPDPSPFENSANGAIVIRTAESHASYLRSLGPSTSSLVTLLSERFRDTTVIVLPRYREQEEELSEIDSPNVVVGREPFFGPNLLKGCSLLVGGGGTMNAEAALLGVPVLSFYPNEPTIVERYLLKIGLLRRVRSLKECLREASRILEGDGSKELIQRAGNELGKMENPADFIAKQLLGWSDSKIDL